MTPRENPQTLGFSFHSGLEGGHSVDYGYGMGGQCVHEVDGILGYLALSVDLVP